MRPIIRIAAPALIAVMLTALFVFPPSFLVSTIAKRVLGSWVSWQSITVSGWRGILLKGVEVQAQPARIEVLQIKITDPPLRALAAGVWDFDLKDIAIRPRFAKPLSLNFDSGLLRYRVNLRQLELQKWVSKSAKIDEGVIRWAYSSGSAEITSLHVAGRALPSALIPVLNRWKAWTSPDGPEDTEWQAFDIQYDEGRLEIEINSKPFFRAQWKTANRAI